jgi:hypothetical protein
MQRLIFRLLVSFALQSLTIASIAETAATGAAGMPEHGKTKLLEAGAEVLQSARPLRSIHTQVCGLHFYSGDLKRQVVSYHYCAHLNDEVRQCVIYDSDRSDARLIGVEYIISGRLFQTLPEDEKRLWHSHRFEVKSGELVAPGLPAPAEKELMKTLVGTYGKTWHFWQVDRGDPLPLGLPQLMMALTADGQVDEALLKIRDQDLGVSTETKKQQRSDIPDVTVSAGADAWQHEAPRQLNLTPVAPSP